MAEGSRERYSGQDVSQYNDGYPVPPSQNYPTSQLPMFPIQQNLYVQPFPRGVQFPPYQNNMYPFAPQSQVQTRHQYENGQYYTGNQHQGNLPFDNRTNMQFQPNYVMYGNVRPPANITPPAVYDNSYISFNASRSYEFAGREYPVEGADPQNQDWQNNKYTGRQNKFQSGNNSSESKFASMAEGNASRNNVPRGKGGSPEANEENSPKTSTKEPSPEYPTSEKKKNDSSKSEHSINNSGAYEGKEKKKNDSSEYGHCRSSGTYEGKCETGARTRDQGWGRGGRGGRRGGRRYNDLNFNSYSRFGSQESAEEMKRERDNTLAETAAFLKILNSGPKKTEGNTAQDSGNGRMGGRGGRYDRGGDGRGGSRGYQQRDVQGEEKQGKEWTNRQVRTEKEKGYYDMQNMYTRQNRGMTTNRGGQKYERTGNSYEHGKWDSQNRSGGRTFERSENKEFNGKEAEEEFKRSAPLGSGGRMVRGRGGRGRPQDGKLWDNNSGALLESSSEQQNNRRRTYDISSTNTSNVEEKEALQASKKSPDTQCKKNVESYSTKPQAQGKKNVESQSTEDEETQRDRLAEQLTKGSYECMVCCDRIKQQQAIWSCLSCYNCFHLGCIKKWAKSSTGEGGWRCPACQGSTPKVPSAYMCFCGKVREPEWNRHDLAHSCGEVCGRRRKIEWCKHKCNILCHPGPCPPCTAFIKRWCACGAVSRDVKCSVTEPYLCGGTCGKLLSCQSHKCEKTCHADPCGDCQHIVQQTCHCGKNCREVACSPDTIAVSTYSCEGKCGRELECENHQCESKCHPGNCQPCQRAVDIITCCPCGKIPLEKLYERDGAKQRLSCSDPVPTCNQPCQLKLNCGVPGAFHQCQAMCHEGPCPPCPLQTPVRCRCGAMDCDIPCSELTTKADEVTCKKPCKKLRHCGRHKCNTKCCIDVDHLCSLPCGRMLSCGLHKCEESCHRGNCPRCWQTSFEELTCHCGASVLYPPVPCGTKPPVCDNPCRRPQPCPHPASHLCHPEEPCPPCTMLVDKPCFGGHKIMRRTLCYLKAVSCGGVCGNPLPCGIHQCQRVCHEPPCVAQENVCPQKCLKPRESCGHPCANPCHSGPCPDNSCKEMVKISCQCGLRKTSLQCSENDREYRAVATSILASQMQSLNNGCTVDLSEIFTATARPDKLKRLPCNEECQMEERNRRLALALQIENPEAREKLGSSSLYSDFMKDEARKDPNLAKTVHGALTELVMKTKESKQKSCIHSFPSMNREKRHFVHEYCEHFGCKSESYDEEPNKNVVATAVKGMCYLPPVSVLEQLQREQGQRKVPAPVWSRKSSATESSQGMQKLEKTRVVKKIPSPAASKSPPIDYFDFEN